LIPVRSIVAEVRERRAKILRLDESRHAPKQTRCQLEDEKRARKAECIAIFEHCRKISGISLREFVERWGHALSTGYGYLSDEKRYPKPRSVRKAKALQVLIEAEVEERDEKAGKVQAS
jgi:hypothetical protein